MFVLVLVVPAAFVVILVLVLILVVVIVVAVAVVVSVCCCFGCGGRCRWRCCRRSLAVSSFCTVLSISALCRDQGQTQKSGS